MDLGLLVIRVVFGGLLVAHGTQKLFGWWDGGGWRGTADGFEQMGYNPGEVFGTLAGLTEVGGGLLLALGLLTPLAGAVVLGTMLNAINAMWSHGLLGGYEVPLVFAIVGAVIPFTGSGKFAMDAGRPWERHGFVWGVGALLLALVTGVLTLICKWAL